MPKVYVLALIGALGCGAPSDLGPSEDAGPRPTEAWIQLAADAEPGTRIEVWGRVLTPALEPAARAEVHVFHADTEGRYGNEDAPEAPARLEGRVVTDAEGRFGWSTVVPGAYGGGPPHFHVFVTPAGAARQIAALNVYAARIELFGPADSLPARPSASFPLSAEATPWRCELELVLSPDGA